MTSEWRMGYGFPALARLPGTLPWKLALRMGREPAAERRATEDFLVTRFGQVFPQATQEQHRQWAAAHMDLVALEMMDAVALDRLGAPGGPALELAGWEHVQRLVDAGRGFIIVLNHFDRLMASLAALARQGVRMNAMTMPVLDHPDLSAVQRRFLTRKMGLLAHVMGGRCYSATDSLREVHESLCAGQNWVILADVWRPGLGKLRAHPFLGGSISLPTGIERLARAARAPLIHAAAHTQGADRLSVVVDPLPEEPRAAMDAVVQRLNHDVQQRPWAWWQWGLWDLMWSPSAEGERLG